MYPPEICFIIIYNHNYEKNIETLEKIYKDKFKNIFHIMPFYNGNKDNVIGVYESSFQFNGYITQALPKIYNKKYSHYLFIADDIILNPVLNEKNLCQKLKLDKDSGYISKFSLITNNDFLNWNWALSSYFNLLNGGKACEFQRFLPDLKGAQKKFTDKGIDINTGATLEYFNILKKIVKPNYNAIYSFLFLNNIKSNIFRKIEYLIRKILYRKKQTFINFFIEKEYEKIEIHNLLYPLAVGYSDFTIIPQTKILEFSHTSGILAAARIFAENSIPTAMIFTLDKIITDEDLLLKSLPLWKEEEVNELENKHNYSIKHLINNFPEDVLLYHPIKLSKWSLDDEKQYSYNKYISTDRSC